MKLLCSYPNTFKEAKFQRGTLGSSRGSHRGGGAGSGRSFSGWGLLEKIKVGKRGNPDGNL